MNCTHYSTEILRLAGKHAKEGTGGSVEYVWHKNVSGLLNYLATLTSVLGDGMSINGDHKEAESVALALNHQGEYRLAFVIFKVIVSNTPPREILFLRGKRSTYASEAFSPVKGKLGYEGTFQFALLALNNKDKERAKALFIQIVDGVPEQCFPIRLQDVRLESLSQLKKLGVKTLPNGISIEEAYRRADSCTY